ncbi:LysR family transcriptional regulator [Richelia sinica]|uniref:LysR family transcriptional regulator n=1 Tax=Richelia sinica TaxID=1357545 RepID=UPI0016857BD9|nr:LysR family transcriptional regulator [Richelia sinica]MBD2665168.1 LysR family transcriptional regulator [Richelia sinica FACHB-800]
MEIPDLNALVVFAHVVKQGSFVGAAQRLNLPKATVSRRIQQLEDFLQVKLLERSTRVVRLTEIGKLYYEYCDRIVAEIEEGNAAIDEQQAEPQGILRTSAPSAFTHLFLKDLIPEFLSRYPKIRLNHCIMNQEVNPLQEGFDISIRIGRIEDSLLRIQPLGELSRQLFASPTYLKRHHTPRTLAELGNHDTIITGNRDSPHWELCHKLTGNQTIVLNPRCWMNDPTIAFEMVLAGVGIGLLPVFFCIEAIQSGALVPLLEDWCAAPVPLSAIFPTTRERSPKVKAFLQFLQENLQL